MADLRIRAVRAITPDGERTCVLEIEAGVVTYVRTGTGDAAEPTAPADEAAGNTPNNTAADRVAELRLGPDEVLLPGLVDSHVHVNEPGRTEWEGFVTATAAAAAGGVTTIVDMPLNSIPATVDVGALALKQASATGRIDVDVAFWGGAVPGNVDDLEPLWQAGVVGFKCFLLPSGVQEFPPLDQSQLVLAMRRIASFDGLLIAHAEDQAVIDRAPVPSGPDYRRFLASRPPQAEESAIGRLIDAIRETGCRTHIVHLSAASALPMIAAARAEGLPLTVETCPHYLTLAAEAISNGATEFKCCPPIRDLDNRDRLWDGLAAGVIDAIVSDHSPSTIALKAFDTGDFGLAWGGISSLQLGLPIIWTEARRRNFSLVDVVRWMSSAPAHLAGLATGGAAKGSLALGFAADLVVFAPDAHFTVDVTRLEHRNPVSAYAGATLDGVVRQTWLAGRQIFGVVTLTGPDGVATAPGPGTAATTAAADRRNPAGRLLRRAGS